MDDMSGLDDILAGLDYSAMGFGTSSPEESIPMQGMVGMPMNMGMGMDGVPMGATDMYGMPMQGAGMMGDMPIPQATGFPPQMQPQGYIANQYTQQQLMQMAYAGRLPNRALVIQCLREYVMSISQVPISAEVKLEEMPQLLKHACYQCGVSRLPMNTYSVQEFGINIPFYFCKGCGKLYYIKDFM